MIQKVLHDIGLDEKESEIYLSCLKLGSAKIAEIAENAKINRITAYTVIERLMDKGFVTMLMRENKQTYIATDPSIISEMLDKKVHRFKSNVKKLKSLSGIKTPLKITYFEGIDELKKIYEDTLESKTEILNIINEEAIHPIWPNYESEYVLKRVEKKIHLRGIAIDTEKGERLKAKDNILYREIRLINPKKFSFSNDIMIYDSKVAILSWLSLGGLIIDNDEIAKTHRTLFEMSWEDSGE